MKWFLIGSLCLFCSATWVKGDAAGDLYNQGVTALQNQQYAEAAKAFDSIITGYPTSPNINEVRIRAGFAFLNAGDYASAIDRLAPEIAPNKPQFRGTALYFTALAQFSQGQKETDKSKAGGDFTQAVTTLTTLINLITTAPDAENKGYLEQAIYYRALSAYSREDYAAAEKDLLQVIQEFSGSLSLPDYYLRLGSLYAVETNQAVTEKKPDDEINSAAKKALDAFDHVSRDPNALVQANEANMSKAEVLFLIAQLDTTSDGYQKALEAFRQVRRKADMIPLQQKRLDDLKAATQAQLQASPTSFTNDSSLLIAREEGRLKDLQSGPDPIIEALIRMAECYVSMKEPDEARTILHRLIAHAKLTPDQQQEVDFQILYSYVLGGQIDQANKALDDYLRKHSGDPQADSISYQMAAKLMERKDYAGALAQAVRSVNDFPFPKGRYAADAIALQAQALNRLGRIPEADKVVNDFLAQNPTSPVANSMFLTKAQGESSRGDFTNALSDYQKVKDNASASTDLRSNADAGYIQTLSSLKRFDDVITEAKSFLSQYPQSKVLPTVLLFSGLALEQKHDPGAVAALQNVAHKFPQDPAAPFALFYVVSIYERTGDVPAMIQAYKDLQATCPDAYTFLVQAADAVSTVLIKQKKFDDAIALYQPLTQAPKPDVAAAAQDKIGAVWLASAHALGYYQSMPLPTRAEAEKRLANAEQTYLQTLKNSPDQLAAVGDAFEGLTNIAKQRRSWGLLKDADMEGYLTKLATDLTTPDMQARLEMAKAGLVFIYKDGAKQYAAALDRDRKVIEANPGLRLTRQETNQFGELLLAANDYPTALKIYTDLLNGAASTDQITLGDAYYGLGATYLGQGDVAQAKDYFMKLKSLPGNGLWHPHILDANFGVALADEQSSDAAAAAEAQQIYAQLMQAQQGGVALQAKAMLGYGRVLEKAGYPIKPSSVGPSEFAVHYYQEPHLLFGPATPEQSAEGLYDAGQAYAKSGDKVNARAQYDLLLKTYSTTAPDWAAKAQTAEAAL